MRQLTVHKNDENQRLDKYLKKYLKEAPGSFIYKMLRKKNIVLNGKKADGTEKLSAGDEIKLIRGQNPEYRSKGDAGHKEHNTFQQVHVQLLSLEHEPLHHKIGDISDQCAGGKAENQARCIGGAKNGPNIRPGPIDIQKVENRKNQFHHGNGL